MKVQDFLFYYTSYNSIGNWSGSSKKVNLFWVNSSILTNSVLILWLDIDMLKFILALKKYNLKSFVLQQEQTMEDKIFNQIEQKFKELVFEIQMQDNKKIIEFQQKLQALKQKLDLEKELSKQEV